MRKGGEWFFKSLRTPLCGGIYYDNCIICQVSELSFQVFNPKKYICTTLYYSLNLNFDTFIFHYTFRRRCNSIIDLLAHSLPYLLTSCRIFPTSLYVFKTFCIFFLRRLVLLYDIVHAYKHKHIRRNRRIFWYFWPFLGDKHTKNEDKNLEFFYFLTSDYHYLLPVVELLKWAFWIIKKIKKKLSFFII